LSLAELSETFRKKPPRKIVDEVPFFIKLQRLHHRAVRAAADVHDRNITGG
jgi:hypothetical protein